MRSDPGRLEFSSFSLKAIMQRACEVQDFQISGPDWMASTRFDVVAKLPADTPRSKVPEMLRSLLAERFKMATHRETKELPMYALVVGKNGPKMKESEVDPNTPPPDGGRGPGVPAANGGATANGGAGAEDCGPRGETAVVAGWMINKGLVHMQGLGMNMASLTNTLAALLGRPAVDQTGLKGNYDFDLDYTPDEGPRMSPGGAPPPPPLQAGGAPGWGAVQIPSASTPDPDGVSLLNAVQSQLGLKLEARKGPVELIVVDHIEKTPTEN